MKNTYKNPKVEEIIKKVGRESEVIVKNIILGKGENVEAWIIYVKGQAKESMIDESILKPLMLQINSELVLTEDLPEYLCKKYITSSNSKVSENIDEVVGSVKSGYTAIIVDDINTCILINTIGGNYRSISDPLNEYSVKGTRESFVENLDTNVSIMGRRIKDTSFTVEKMVVGRRSGTNVALIYIKDIVNEDALNSIRQRIQAVDVDFTTSNGILEQYIEKNTYSVFPELFTTERPDVVEANLMEGKIAILQDGTPNCLTAPAVFIEFFQGPEDYYQKTLVANLTRILRYIALILIITFPSIYLTLIKFNVELIPLKFIVPITQSRVNIALPPFFEILSMEIIVELLREGGLRLPSKIAQTISIVGGIIIGDTAIQAKIVSPPTLLIVGITVVSTFLIPNYDMSLAIRFLRFPMLILANFLGIFGISVGWFLIITHLYNMDSFGVPYFALNKEDMKDTFIRAPLWKMKRRPKDIAYKNIIRQGFFKNKFRGNDNG
ncbi:spore germination protein [Clostridium sp. JNZ J1-5]